MNLKTLKILLAEYFKTKPVLRAWIFGSFSRGEENENSDIDILVDLDHSHKIGLEFFGMFEELRLLLGRPIDFVTTNSLAPFAKSEVNKDKILVYEREL